MAGFRKRRVRSYRGRGAVYSWLRAHYRDVAAGLASAELSWAQLAGILAREGLEGRNGVGVTARAAAQVWRRVSRDVEMAAAEKAAKAPKRKYPSRISPNWRPQIVAQPAAAAPPVIPLAADAPAAGPAKPAAEAASEHAREVNARLDAQLAKLDRKFRW